jgi:[ribosomal protein S18]-alanine N-acetyltransferase
MGSGAWTTAWRGHLNATVRVPAIIRPASSADIAVVAGIERASFSDPWSEDSFRELLQMRDAIFLVATLRAPETVAGYVIARVVAGEADVLNFAVSPADRRHGLGGELLDAGLAAVIKRGVREVFLEVRESNVAALALYGSRGFTAVSRRGKYYRNPVEDALLLRRAIEG